MFKFVLVQVQNEVHSIDVHLILMKRYFDVIQCPNVLELTLWCHLGFHQRLHLKLL